MNRREFLGVSAGAVVGGYLSRGRREGETIGLQLSTVRDAFVRDPEGTLAAVAGIGYREVELYELYGPAGWPVSRLRGALDRAGVAARGVWVSTPLLYRGLDRHAAVAAALGCTYLVCSGVDPDERRAARDWHELAAVFNRAGEAARRSGLRVAYRSHDYDMAHDMVAVGGVVPFDILLAETDPSLVWFEIDASVGDAHVGDPVAYLQSYRGRFSALRVGERADQRVLMAGRAAGVARYVVEIDHPTSAPIESARRAYAALGSG
jgi:sugar phosphate isomerase/epimerase